MLMGKLKKRKEYSISLSKGVYTISLILILFSYYFGINNNYKKSPFLMALAFIFSFIAFVFVKNSYRYTQILPIYLFFALFWDVAFVNCVKNMDTLHLVNGIIGLFCLNIPVLRMIIWNATNKIKYKFQRNGIIICAVISCVFIIGSLRTLNSMARLDTNIYYNCFDEVLKWNMGFDTVDVFFLGGHQCMGYAIWGAIGKWLCRNSPVGIRIIDLILVIITIFLLYCLLEAVVKNDILAGIYTLLFAFNPLIFGIIYEINLDLPLTCFYIWVLYSLYKKDNIKLLVSSLFLVFSKEIGIVLLFGIFVGWIMFIITQERKKSITELNVIKFCIFAIVGSIWFSNQMLGLIWRQDSLSNKADYITMDSFAFQVDNIIAKMKEIFLVNFSWIFVLLCICAIFIKILRHDKVKQEKSSIMYMVITSFIFNLMFQFSYVTYVHMRYIMPCIVGIIIIFAKLSSLVLSVKKQCYVTSVLAFCIFVQSFWSIDPINDLVFPQINIGETKLMTTRVFTRGSGNEANPRNAADLLITSLEMTQSAIYNRQFMYFELLFQNILQEIDYNDETLVVISPTYEGYDGMTRNCFFGDWYSKEIHYDETNYRLTSDSRKPIVNCLVWGEKEIDLKNYTNVYYIDFPYNKNFDNQEIVRSLQYLNKFDIEKYGWEASVYHLK